MKKLLWIVLSSSVVLSTQGQGFRITSLTGNGTVSVTNAFTNGVVTVERASTPSGPWVPDKNIFSVCAATQLNLAVPGGGSFFRALRVDLSGVGSWLFSADDIIDLGSLANRLTAASPDAVSAFVWSQLSPNTMQLVGAYGIYPDSDVVAALVPDLNGILQGPPIYDTNRFAGVTLSPATQALLAKNPQDSTLIALNRMLLDDAYPVEFVNKQDNGFPNLTASYGLLTTVAGSGNVGPDCKNACNNWQDSFEGGYATNATLSRAHISMADRAGNIYIADKEAQGIRKVTPDGRIYTVAGINTNGFGDTNPAPAITVALSNPNGLWVREDGSFYILDTGNGLVRKVDTNGMMTTVVNNGTNLITGGGRGLWVSPDESIIYFCDFFDLKCWDTTNGLRVCASGFGELGNIAVDPKGNMVVTDLRADRVLRLESNGTRTVLAGNGNPGGGGDGQLATATGLDQVRAIWFLPSGAFFLGTEGGNFGFPTVWYVDTDGYIHLLLTGNFYAHAGDGGWFYDQPSLPKIGGVRQITMDYEGNLLITESDFGYVRKIDFKRLQP